MKMIQVFLFWTCALVGVGNSFAASDSRPDLVGRVSETNGPPVAKATVFIYTAGPKEGTSSLCPYCYADCQKKAQTDADGRFKIESLDPTLIFRLLVIANGHESKIVSKVDPTNGEQKIILKPLSEEALKSNLRIKGMVVGEDGKPVPEAVISPEGVGMGQGTRWGGNDQVVEPLAVADEQGHFVLFCKSNVVDMVYATADGRGVAKQWVSLKPGEDYLIHMREGVTVTGQITRNGQPLKGVSVAVTTTEREAGKSFNVNDVATDSNGHFQILNVPPDREFVFYSKMSSLHGDGALPDKIFNTSDSGAIQDLGELAVQPAFKVTGRIVLSDGKPIPAGTKLLLSREKAWDSTQVTLGTDGTFGFNGVPAETVGLSARIKGYKFSKRNPSLDWLNGRILGRVTGDMTNLDFLMEPGAWQFNQEGDRPDGAEAYPADKPLSSVKL
jgi:uncharacterized GH25 family protein